MRTVELITGDLVRTLYVQGRASYLTSPVVAVIGSRRASPWDLMSVTHHVKSICVRDTVIATTMALGVGAHVLETVSNLPGGRTFAALATPTHLCYPKQFARLQERIARDHLCVSPFSREAPFLASNFPETGRMLAELADMVYVSCAGHSSGTRHVVRRALELGKPVVLDASLLIDSSHWAFGVRDRVFVLDSGQALGGLWDYVSSRGRELSILEGSFRYC